MTMRVQKLYQKGSGVVNEDQLLVKKNLFAVFDGATGLVPYRNREGKTGGSLAAEIAKTTFAQNGRPLQELAKEANQNILATMKRAHVDIRNRLARWSTHVVAVRIFEDQLEFFSIGDALILAIFKNRKSKLLVKYHNHDLPLMIKWKTLAKKRVPNIWERLNFSSKKLRQETNVTYGMLNGDPNAVRFFQYGIYPLHDVRSIIIFTDGLMLPKKDPRAREDWEKFAQLYLQSGLAGMARFIRRLEKTDPNCWKYPRYKQHDDIAAIGIDF